MKFNTIIIEDETLAAERMVELLEPYEEITILQCIDNGKDAITQINKQKPDLIFLDIQIPQFNGFEVLERIEYSPIVIFTTAYDEFALKAFENFAIDYLLKPINKTKLDRAIKKLNKLKQNSFQEIKKERDLLIRYISNNRKKNIAAKCGDDIFFIELKDIYYFKADQKYVSIKTYDKTYLINDSLSTLEKSLTDNFIRIHRSYIINIEQIKKLIKWFRNQYKAVMKDKDESVIPVNKDSKNKLFEKMTT